MLDAQQQQQQLQLQNLGYVQKLCSFPGK